MIAAGSSDTSEALSLALGVIGLFLTLLGLFLTYMQAKRAATSSKAAQSAVSEFRSRVAVQDAAKDLTTAMLAIDTTSKHLANDAWKDALESYELARRSLIDISLGPHKLNDNERGHLSTLAEEIGSFCNKVNKAAEGNGKYPVKFKAQDTMRKYYDQLAKIKRSLHEEIES